jgi:glucose/arabinose dehydrogenase
MQRTMMTTMILLLAIASVLAGQQTPIGAPVPPLGAGPFVFDTAEQHKLRVVVVAKGLSHPWSMAFLPDGRILVTERAGNLRIVRDGVLNPQPVSGVPKVSNARLAGLMDIAIHPQFAANGLVYLTYSKPEPKMFRTALARGRLEGNSLVDVRELFQSEVHFDNAASASRVVFGRDGMLYMSIGGATVAGQSDKHGQDPSFYSGKIIRLRDDGSVPADNPFAGKAGYKPEIYSLGHRNQLGLFVHPETGEIWQNENGPNGGDEVNIIRAGRNYGWPTITYGRTYQGPRVSDKTQMQGLEEPVVVWSPSIAVSGLTIYTGSKFPNWKNNIFVGGLRMGEIPGTGHLQRVVLNERGEEMRREMLLTDLKQRIRDVRQSPDGFLYVLTEEDNGALLRLEPADAPAR